ncbi:uncharacterized protein B0H64DRAFT_74994 [Chaetomium fimeti]|uniref:Uncharacterized protein n=1 Tax=Chaetomium fimeti TaxID=1854472 RepID=A0AAE0LUX4_9PEZI|nr:hypothetical protein B0H64DRAFT_74994 [Chaetomium fimeti]
MPDIHEVSYSREATIAAVREYYRFLTRMYLKECDVAEPPEEGWPEIDTEALSGLGKTDEVISLLRHLPYIHWSVDDETEGAAMCRFADWRSMAHSIALGKLSVDDVRATTNSSLPDSISPHVVSITSGGLRNQEFLLDTRLGIVYWYECHSDIRQNPSREPILGDAYDDAPEDEMDWRVDSVAWAIADFFELLKDQFRQLNSVPISPRKVYYASTMEGMPMIQAIYQAHGWPNLHRYRKQDCLKEVQDLLQERYPSYADRRHDE